MADCIRDDITECDCPRCAGNAAAWERDQGRDDEPDPDGYAYDAVQMSSCPACFALHDHEPDCPIAAGAAAADEAQ